jgi:hypothetical protein
MNNDVENLIKEPHCAEQNSSPSNNVNQIVVAADAIISGY